MTISKQVIHAFEHQTKTISILALAKRYDKGRFSKIPDWDPTQGRITIYHFSDNSQLCVIGRGASHRYFERQTEEATE